MYPPSLPILPIVILRGEKHVPLTREVWCRGCKGDTLSLLTSIKYVRQGSYRVVFLVFQASSNCRTAKDELERMCRHLSEELKEFDYRKEQELKQVFIEYAESRFDVFEKVWYNASNASFVLKWVQQGFKSYHEW